MLVVMRQDATAEQIRGVTEAIEARGFKAHPIPGAQRTAIGITGNRGTDDRPVFESMPGVLEVIPVTHAYKLVSREVKPEDSVVSIGGVPVGGGSFVIVAGPCAVESMEQTLTVARALKAAGAHILRGGAFKPRTSPYSFQGLGEEGLRILAEGNYQVVLCERGVRTFSDFSRNTLDLAVVPAVKKLSHLPILVDPSHGTGRRDKVAPLSRAAAAVGADGVMVEVHHDPDVALSDGPQSITPDMFAELVGELRQIAPVIGRRL